jgi:AcrR family transcriptional regulator
MNAKRRERILESASRLFAGPRFDEVLMEDIARAAGVGKGTLYRYFRDKEELYAAVVFAGIADLKEQLRRRLAEGAGPVQRLEAALRAIVAFLGSKRFFFRLMTREDSKAGNRKDEYWHRWRQERGELTTCIAQILQEGAAGGLFEVRHPQTEAQILLGMARSALRFNEDKLSAEEVVEEILRIFLHGIQRRS